MEDRLYIKLGIKKGITAFVGSGGKTTLIRKLAYELKKDGFKVIVTTSTKVLIPGYCSLICNPLSNIDYYYSKIVSNGIVAVGRPILAGDGIVKLEESTVSFKVLADLADFVLVEADGSKHLPIKAHSEFEPVIPDCSNLVVQVLGIWGIGKAVSAAVHRYEIFSRISGLKPEEAVTVEAVAMVINTEDLSDMVYFTGGCEDDYWIREKLAELIDKPVFDEKVGLWISDK